MFHSIKNRHTAVLKWFAIQQLKVYLPFHFVKERNAGTEQHRMDVESDLINQVGLEQRLRKVAPTHHANIFALLLLQLPDESRSIFGYDFH